MIRLRTIEASGAALVRVTCDGRELLVTDDVGALERLLTACGALEPGLLVEQLRQWKAVDLLDHRPPPGCVRCHDFGWVCEAHPDRPWERCGCGAPGEPCPDCNAALGADSPPDPPMDFRTYADKRGTRH